MIELVHAVVLRAEDVSEFDKRVTLYTMEYGKIKAKVTGVKKAASKLRTFTNPFVESNLQIYLHGNPRMGMREPGKIVGGEMTHCHTILRTEWDRMVQTTALCEIIDALTHPFYPSSKEYQLLASSLAQMETTAAPILVRLRFTLIFLKILGYSLRHHPVWMSYSEKEKGLLKRLAQWKAEDELFSKDDIGHLKEMTDKHLSQYLPRPLKSDLFQKKIDAAALACKPYVICL